MTIVEAIEQVSSDLEKSWIPEAWRESASALVMARVEFRSLIIDGLTQSQFQKFQKPEPLTIDEQKRFAGVLAGSNLFRVTIPIKFAALRAQLGILCSNAVADLYERVSNGIASAYNSNTPDAVEVMARVTREDKAKLRGIRYKGLTYSEHLDALISQVPMRIRGLVLAKINQHGTMSIAQRAIVDEYGSMFDKLARDIEFAFRQIMLAAYKAAERDMNEVVRV